MNKRYYYTMCCAFCCTEFSIQACSTFSLSCSGTMGISTWPNSYYVIIYVIIHMQILHWYPYRQFPAHIAEKSKLYHASNISDFRWWMDLHYDTLHLCVSVVTFHLSGCPLYSLFPWRPAVTTLLISSMVIPCRTKLSRSWRVTGGGYRLVYAW